MVVVKTGNATLIDGLSKRSQYQQALSLGRQWAIGSIIAAVGVTIVSPGNELLRCYSNISAQSYCNA